MIATAATLEDGSPFPTLYYLTCPHLGEAVSREESAGGVARWREAVQSDEALADRMRAADARYRDARAAEAAGADPAHGVGTAGRVDPTPHVGIAGQADPLGIKCLHAHVAALLAGIDDPVGEGVLAMLARECADDRCGKAGS